MSENEPARLGVLFSGGGRTLENLAQQVAQGSLRAQIAVAISSHPEAGGIARAQRFGIPTRVVDWREHKADFSARILAMLDEARVDWIVLAGFLRYLDFPGRWEGRVLNIHPSLLPRHGGKGFYGDRVHRAVLEAKDRVSGCTVHFVDREYDQGPIILQRAVAVAPDDTPESLAERVFREECRAYPEALRLCLEGKIALENGRVVLRGQPRFEDLVSPPEPGSDELSQARS